MTLAASASPGFAAPASGVDSTAVAIEPLATRASRCVSVVTVIPPKVASVRTLACDAGKGLNAA